MLVSSRYPFSLITFVINSISEFNFLSEHISRARWTNVLIQLILLLSWAKGILRAYTWWQTLCQLVTNLPYIKLDGREQYSYNILINHTFVVVLNPQGWKICICPPEGFYFILNKFMKIYLKWLLLDICFVRSQLHKILPMS